MRHVVFAFVLALLWAPQAFAQAAKPPTKPTWSIAVHGGAGVPAPGTLTPEREAAIRADLDAAVRAGAAVLEAGGASLDAVTAAVVTLEDSPHFNAGRGAVFNDRGVNEMDAAVMVGADRRGGAVTGVKRVRNPVLAARAVMEGTRHVLLAGEAADAFAEERGLALEPPHYFFTQHRWDAYLAARAAAPKRGQTLGSGTVGAVAVDAQGGTAAATSTGGLTYKMAGRVGDTPILGAGTYAEKGCAASGTGQGESFMRTLATRAACAHVASGRTPQEAADLAIADLLAVGGDGGLIVVDAKGRLALRFSGEGMYRAEATARSAPTVSIYR